MAIHYIAKTSDYWLRVQIDKGPIVSVPYGLKVDRLEVKKGREYFTILEGADKGKLASVQVGSGQSYLTTKLSHKSGAIVKFDRTKQELYVGSSGPYNAFSGGGHRGFTPVAPGTYLLAIPAYPSAQTRREYNTWCSHHNMWFRIGIDTTGSRFLHAGVISDGCVTVRQFIYDPAKGKPPTGFADLEDGAKGEPGLLGLPLPAKPAPCVDWDEVVDALILCRQSDQAVGRLVVV
jgi:hypothetical protein